MIKTCLSNVKCYRFPCLVRSSDNVFHSSYNHLLSQHEQSVAISFFRRTTNRSNSDSSSSSSSFSRKVRAENPFDILGIPKTATYNDAKRKFVELALVHHPDLADKAKSGGSNNSTQGKGEKEPVNDFIRIRKAFEALKEGTNGQVLARSEGDEGSWSSDEEFFSWIFEETGHADLMFRMDIKTRKEVIDVVNSQSQGGLDKGGMWEMARKMADQEEILRNQKGKFRKTALGLETSSSYSDPDVVSNTRRRKRR